MNDDKRRTNHQETDEMVATFIHYVQFLAGAAKMGSVRSKSKLLRLIAFIRDME